MELLKDLQELDIFKFGGCKRRYLCLFVFKEHVIFECVSSGNVMIWDKSIDFIDVEILLRNF